MLSYYLYVQIWIHNNIHKVLYIEYSIQIYIRIIQNWILASFTHSHFAPNFNFGEYLENIFKNADNQFQFLLTSISKEISAYRNK